MINYFLGIVLLTVPFFIKAAPATTPLDSQEFLFAVFTAIGLCLFGARKSHANIKIMAVALFFFAFLATNPFGHFQRYQLGMSVAGLAFTLLVYGNRKEINPRFLGRIMGAVCLLESCWVFVNRLGADPYHTWLTLNYPGKIAILEGIIPITGSLGNIGHSGALIACTMPFLGPYFWPFPIVALFIGGSSLPVICAVIGALTLMSYLNRNFWPLIAGALALFWSGVALLCGLLDGSYFSDSGRIRAWKLLISDLGFQLWGKGLGWVPEVFSRHRFGSERFYQAHNEWLELYAIGGLLSVVVALYLLTPVFKNKGNPAVNACLISLLVNSLGNFTFHIAPLFMVFGTCYALQLSGEK